MPSHAAIAVHDDLASRKAAVALGAADDEPPGRIDEDLCLSVHQFRGDDFPNDPVEDVLAYTSL